MHLTLSPHGWKAKHPVGMYASLTSTPGSLLPSSTRSASSQLNSNSKDSPSRVAPKYFLLLSTALNFVFDCKGWDCGSSSRTFVQQEQGPHFKPEYCKKYFSRPVFDSLILLLYFIQHFYVF
jgi:hypothetical protein